MKFPFYILSLLTLFPAQLMTEKVYASASQFDLEYQRKHGKRLVPKNFRKNPLSHMTTALPDILGTGVGFEQELYIRKMFQGNKLYIFESEKLHKPSQLGSNWQLTLVNSLNIQQKVKETVWHFKVTVLADSQGQAYAAPAIYSFRLTKYPYEDMLKLAPEARQDLGQQVANHRKIIKARPGSLTPDYPRQASTMLEVMETVPPLTSPIYGPHLPTAHSIEDITQKISQIAASTPSERDHERRKKQWKAAKDLSIRMTTPTAPNPVMPTSAPTSTTTRNQQQTNSKNKDNINRQ